MLNEQRLAFRSHRKPGPIFPRLCGVIVGLFIVQTLPTPVNGETFNFRSQTSQQSYTANIGGELAFPNGRGPFPVVVLLHACGGLDRWGKASLSAHATTLRQAGFATYILDSFSARGLDAEKVCDKGGAASEFRLDDRINATAALKQNSKVAKDSFFALGQSHGASVAIWAAINTANRQTFRAVAAFYPDCRAVRHSLKIKSPTIILAAEKDDWTPVAVCNEAKERVRPDGSPLKLIIYPDAHHAFDQQRPPLTFKGHTLAYSEKATTNSRKAMLDFFKEHLANER